MNNFSALAARVLADRPQYILDDNIFYKSECVLFWYWDELYCYAWRTCYNWFYAINYLFERDKLYY